MQGTRLIKRRIKTTRNIRQITKAMEMVSASKMKRAQFQALGTKPYSNKLQETLQRVTAASDPNQHRLLKKNKLGDTVVLLVSSDKGLTGGLVTNLFRGAEEFLTTLNSHGHHPQFIIIGKKAREYILKMDYPLLAEFSQLPDKISFRDSLPISEMIINGYEKNKYKKVFLIFMDFISTLVQKVTINQILPIEIEPKSLPVTPEEMIDKDVASRYEYIFEPTAKDILDWILPYYVEIQVFQTLLEARASEHSARMVAMKNANENAGEIIDELTLEFNKFRQSAITSELLDIVTAATASAG